MAGALVASPAVADDSADRTLQSYHHLATTEFGTGGSYTASGGDISLSLTGSSGGVEAFVEECGASDLGEVVNIPEGDSEPRVLASDQDVEAGTCFVLVLRSTGEEPTEVEGTLSF